MQKLALGPSTIEKIVEIETMYFDPAWMYYNITPDMLQKHKAALGPKLIHPDTHELGLSFHSFLIRSHGKNIIVDTCNGNHKDRMPRFPFYSNLQSNAYLDNLQKVGLRPEDIDIVLCTHLHTDHVGWNTRLSNGQWVPTFPNAEYIWSAKEFAYFKELNEKNTLPTTPFLDSIQPVFHAGLARLVDMDHVIVGDKDDGVWMEPATGHTPGHVTIHVKGGGTEAIMTGDIIHHPILFLEPGLATQHDVNKAECDRTRQRLLERLSDTRDLLLTAHFCAPTAGRVHSCQHGFRFQYLEEKA